MDGRRGGEGCCVGGGDGRADGVVDEGMLVIKVCCEKVVMVIGLCLRGGGMCCEDAVVIGK